MLWQVPTAEGVHAELRRRLSTQDSIGDVGHPNKEATGIVNDAFDEAILDEESGDLQPSGSADDNVATDGDLSCKDYDPDDALSETNAIHESIATTTTTTTANIITGGATSDSGVAAGSNLDNDITDCGKDPFDTSEFDSSAFDAFASKFEQTSGTGDNSSSYDPFSSPMKTNKNQEPEGGDVFDIFDPFARPSMKTPKNTPARIIKDSSKDSFDDDDDDNLKIVIKAKMKENPNASVSLGIIPLVSIHYKVIQIFFT